MTDGGIADGFGHYYSDLYRHHALTSETKIKAFLGEPPIPQLSLEDMRSLDRDLSPEELTALGLMEPGKMLGPNSSGVL
ncbi:hypothetical protein NDU88_003741 [Pleurodeles waltl]|uniref:Uncharacterized protein n=1 Tax=Pleurodeles waltl TaxID=8319 RepID=A0AAV7QGG1_PLEWA|nr:hypothetical protein NDU88_003741 [Pleurodeles waltl]